MAVFQIYSNFWFGWQPIKVFSLCLYILRSSCFRGHKWLEGSNPQERSLVAVVTTSTAVSVTCVFRSVSQDTVKRKVSKTECLEQEMALALVSVCSSSLFSF